MLSVPILLCGVLLASPTLLLSAPDGLNALSRSNL